MYACPSDCIPSQPLTISVKMCICVCEQFVMDPLPGLCSPPEGSSGSLLVYRHSTAATIACTSSLEPACSLMTAAEPLRRAVRKSVLKYAHFAMRTTLCTGIDRTSSQSASSSADTWKVSALRFRPAPDAFFLSKGAVLATEDVEAADTGLAGACSRWIRITSFASETLCKQGVN